MQAFTKAEELKEPKKEKYDRKRVTITQNCSQENVGNFAWQNYTFPFSTDTEKMGTYLYYLHT